MHISETLPVPALVAPLLEGHLTVIPIEIGQLSDLLETAISYSQTTMSNWTVTDGLDCDGLEFTVLQVADAYLLSRPY